MICPRCGRMFFNENNICPKCNFIYDSYDKKIWLTKKKVFSNKIEISFLQLFLIIIVNLSAICLLVNYFTLQENNWWSIIVASGSFAIYLILKLYATNMLMKIRTFRQLSFLLLILLIVIQQVITSGMWVYNYYMPIFSAISMVILLCLLLFSERDLPSVFFTIAMIAIEGIIPFIMFRSGVDGIGIGISNYCIVTSFIVAIVGVINALILYFTFLKTKIYKIIK